MELMDIGFFLVASSFALLLFLLALYLMLNYSTFKHNDRQALEVQILHKEHHLRHGFGGNCSYCDKEGKIKVKNV